MSTAFGVIEEVALSAFLIIALLAVSLFGLVKAYKSKESTILEVVINIATLLGICFFIWFLFPEVTNWIVFQLLWLNGVYLISLVVLIIGFLIFSVDESVSRKWTIGCAAIIASIIVMFVAYNGSIAATASTYKPTWLEQPISLSPKSFQNLPKNAVFSELRTGQKNSAYGLSESHLDTIFNPKEGNFESALPVTPTSWLAFGLDVIEVKTFSNDHFKIESGKAINSIKSASFVIGEDLPWLRNVKHNLYLWDLFHEYDEVFYLPLIDSKTDEWVTIAPKIGYKYEFPFFAIPQWDGVKIIHKNGLIENLTKEQAIADKRFADEAIISPQVAEKMISSQVADRGFGSNIFARSGKIQFAKLDDESHIQLVLDTSGRLFYQSLLEPQNGNSLFRIYYVDARTGEFFAYEFPEDDYVLSPEQAVLNTLGTTSSVHLWAKTNAEGEVTSGNAYAVNPQLLTRQNPNTEYLDLYFATTIVTKNTVARAGAMPKVSRVSTYVENARNDQEHYEFNQVSQFQDWLNGGEAEISSTPISNSLTGNDEVIKNLKLQIEVLKNLVNQL